MLQSNEINYSDNNISSVSLFFALKKVITIYKYPFPTKTNIIFIRSEIALIRENLRTDFSKI